MSWTDVRFAHAHLECSEHHQIVDQNVLFTRNALQTVLVLLNNVKTHASDHVASMPDVRHKIINRYAHALKVMKVTHMLVAHRVKLFCILRLMYVQLHLAVRMQFVMNIMVSVRVLACKTISVIRTLDVNQNAYKALIVHVILPVSMLSVSILVKMRVA